MVYRIVKFFDKLEDYVRGALSHFPILYAAVGGVLMIVFWRGIWHTSDILMAKGGWLGIIFYEPYTLIWTTIGMLLTGLFVSFFIGDHILISGLKHEKKMFEKSEKEFQEEETELGRVEKKLLRLENDIAEIKSFLIKK